MKLFDLLRDPTGFFESVMNEEWKPSFRFFLGITMILSVFTPVENFLGVESTDFSSAYQAQILAFRLLSDKLLPLYGVCAYFVEPFLIFGLSVMMLLFLTVFLHLVFMLMNGKGPILNAWKASCYGVGPCILGGFLPYVSLFAAFYSLLIQFYIGPKVLYKVQESKAIFFLALLIALTFIKMFRLGTTVGF